MDKNQFTENLSLPLVAAPMFLISGPELVIEACKNGIVGTFPALNQRTTEGFEQWVIQIKTALEAWEKQTGKKGKCLLFNFTRKQTYCKWVDC